MFKYLFSMSSTINGRSINVHIITSFKEDIGTFTDVKKVATFPKAYSIEIDKNYSTNIKVPEDTQLAVVEHSSIDIFIAEFAKKIMINLGNEFTLFNRLISEVKNEYSQKKQREVRLYFWSSQKQKLRLCFDNSDIRSNKPNAQIAYYLRNSDGHIISKFYEKPKYDCFILGRVRQTIGCQNSKLLDCIEPISEIKLGFDAKECGAKKFQDNLNFLEELLLYLFVFCTINNAESTESIEYKRALAYVCTIHKMTAPDIHVYIDEVKEAFKEGNVSDLKRLISILKSPQDCSGLKFKLALKKKPITCNPTSKLAILYENGEIAYETAQWIFNNLYNCTNATISDVNYIMERNKYNFF